MVLSLWHYPIFSLSAWLAVWLVVARSQTEKEPTEISDSFEGGPLNYPPNSDRAQREQRGSDK